MEIKIEKDVPLPVPRDGSSKWAFLAKMEVGDSVYLEGLNTGSWRPAAKQTTAKLDAEFVSRKEGDGIRIWRLK